MSTVGAAFGVLPTLLLGTIATYLFRLGFQFHVGPSGVGSVLQVSILSLVVVQGLFDGWRWSLAPCYVLAAVMALSFPWHDKQSNLVVVGALGGAGLLIISIALTTVASLLYLPMPTGTFSVGVATWSLAMPTTVRPPLPSVLDVSVWYPAREAGRRSPYASSDPAIGWRRRLIMTHATYGAPPMSTTTPLPLLLYVPGWGGSRSGNSVLAMELASHGYVVVAVDNVSAETHDKHVTAPGMDFSSEDGAAATLRLANHKIDIQAQLVSGVLDALLAGERHWDLKLNLDPDRVAIFGYSIGGAVAVEASGRDPRFKAAVNLDGWLFGARTMPQAPRPYLIVTNVAIPPSSPTSLPRDSNPLIERMNRDDDAQQRRVLDQSGGFVLGINGFSHDDFSDSPFFSLDRIMARNHVGTLGAIRHIAAAVVEFFDTALNKNQRPGITSIPTGDGVATLNVWTGKKPAW